MTVTVEESPVARLDDAGAREAVAQVERLIEQLESLPDPRARALAMDAVRGLLDLYGEGLARLMEIALVTGGERTVQAVADDELASHLLLLHGLHPEPVEARVERALDEARPYLRSHGGDVELLRVDDGVAYLSLRGSCSGCPSSGETLRLAVEEAIHRRAPDLERIETDGAAAPLRAAPLVQLEGMRATADGIWRVVGGLPQLAGGGVLLKEVGGEPVLFLRLEDALYAYRHACPGCGRSLGEGRLAEGSIACPGCGRRYDVRRAGRCLDAPRIHLSPVPLLVGDAGIVKVALSPAAA